MFSLGGIQKAMAIAERLSDRLERTPEEFSKAKTNAKSGQNKNYRICIST